MAINSVGVERGWGDRKPVYSGTVQSISTYDPKHIKRRTHTTHLLSLKLKILSALPVNAHTNRVYTQALVGQDFADAQTK